MFVVVSSAGQFWAGANWCNEYPDAMLFQNEDDAVAVMDFGKLNNWEYFVDCSVVKDYGLETERKVG